MVMQASSDTYTAPLHLVVHAEDVGILKHSAVSGVPLGEQLAQVRRRALRQAVLAADAQVAVAQLHGCEEALASALGVEAQNAACEAVHDGLDGGHVAVAMRALELRLQGLHVVQDVLLLAVVQHLWTSHGED